MGAEVQQHGKFTRPSWNYTSGRTRPGEWPGDVQLAQLEMIESVRNVLEAIRGSQMLQCDVAHAIKDMAKTIRRIDRRLAKIEGMKL